MSASFQASVILICVGSILGKGGGGRYNAGTVDGNSRPPLSSRCRDMIHVLVEASCYHLYKLPEEQKIGATVSVV